MFVLVRRWCQCWCSCGVGDDVGGLVFIVGDIAVVVEAAACVRVGFSGVVVVMWSAVVVVCGCGRGCCCGCYWCCAVVVLRVVMK